LPEGVSLEDEEDALLGSDRVRRARLIVEQRQLAMEITWPEASNDNFLAVRPGQRDSYAAAGDHVESGPRVAFEVDHLVSGVGPRPHERSQPDELSVREVAEQPNLGQG